MQNKNMNKAAWFAKLQVVMACCLLFIKVPQSLFFYSDLPTSKTCRFIYTDDLCLAMQAQDFDSLEQVLTEEETAARRKSRNNLLCEFAPRQNTVRLFGPGHSTQIQPVAFAQKCFKRSKTLLIQRLTQTSSTHPLPVSQSNNQSGRISQQPASPPIQLRKWYGSPKQTPRVRSHPAGPRFQPPKETVVNSQQIQDQTSPTFTNGAAAQATVCLWRGASNGTHHRTQDILWLFKII